MEIIKTNIIDNLPEDLLIEGNFETRQVRINGKLLMPEPSQKIINHSPDGFNWGYGGSGPAQLALALLMKFLPPQYARNYYQQFKWNVVAGWPKENFATRLNLKSEIQKIINGVN